MPEVPPPSRRRSPSRPAVLAMVSAGLAVVAVAPASADTARLVGIDERDLAQTGVITQVTEVRPGEKEPSPASTPKASRDARVVVTGADGRSRQLGPFRLAAPPVGMGASPDGRFLVLGASSNDEDDFVYHLYAVPTAGGPAKRLDLPKDAVPLPTGATSFAPDGSELYLGEVAVPDPKANPRRPAPGDVTYASYRCALATGACTAFPTGAGTVVAFPGGTLAASSLFSALSGDAGATATFDDSAPDGTWLPNDGPVAKRLRAALSTPVRTTVGTQGTSARTVSDVRRTLAQGVPVALSAFGGPSGALLTRVTVRTTLQRKGDEVRPRTTATGARLMTVRPDGTSTVGPVPRVTVARSALRHVGRRYAAARPALPFAPVVDRADGSWLGTAGDPAFGLAGTTGLSTGDAGEAVVLATLDGSGSARTVRIGGRDATAETLLRFVPRPGLVRATGPLEILGYERATRTAVVRVPWRAGRGTREETWKPRSAALRVPLDGVGRPTVLLGGVQTAW